MVQARELSHPTTSLFESQLLFFGDGGDGPGGDGPGGTGDGGTGPGGDGPGGTGDLGGQICNLDTNKCQVQKCKINDDCNRTSIGMCKGLIPVNKLGCNSDTDCTDNMYCDMNGTPPECKYPGGPGAKPKNKVLTTNDIVFNMSPETFYTLASYMLRKYCPLYPKNNEITQLLESMNFLPQSNNKNLSDFNWNNILTSTKLKLVTTAKGAKLSFALKGTVFKAQNSTLTNWTSFGQDAGAFIKGKNMYLNRTFAAATGLGLNTINTSVYYSCEKDSSNNIINKLYGSSNKLDGSKHNYIMNFDGKSCISKEKLPPVNSFWSITVYTTDGYPVDSANIHSIGTHSNLIYNNDGGLTLNFDTTDNNYNNWVPIPSTQFTVTFRLYLPKLIVQNGSWIPPFIERYKTCDTTTIKQKFSKVFENPDIKTRAECVKALNTDIRLTNMRLNSINCTSIKDVINLCPSA